MNTPTPEPELDAHAQRAVRIAALQVERRRLQNERNRDLFRMVLSATLAAFLFFGGLYGEAPLATWMSAIPFLFAVYLVTYIATIFGRIEALYQEIERLESDPAKASE
jgi:uncharacterized small protein (DUF1192 family)